MGVLPGYLSHMQCNVLSGATRSFNYSLALELQIVVNRYVGVLDLISVLWQSSQLPIDF